LPPARRDAGGEYIVLIGERRYQFPDEIADLLLNTESEPSNQAE